jgi:hypothetical protein
MDMENMNTYSTYTVGKTIINEQGDRQVVHEDRIVAVTLSTYDEPEHPERRGVYWKGARVA